MGDSPESVALHELQHAIQQREGWARGGSPQDVGGITNQYQQAKTAFDEALKTRTNPNADEIAKANAAQIMQHYGPKLSELKRLSDPLTAYRSLAGEAEARATQARLPLNAEQRRATFPADSYDVPLDSLILLGMAGPAMVAAKAPQIARGMNRMVDNAMAPATMNKQSGKVFVYPQDEALATAQRNAAKPVSEGGLGLHPDNTAMERAKAMGFSNDVYHGTPKQTEFLSLNPSAAGSVYATKKKDYANDFAKRKMVIDPMTADDYVGQVLPLKANLGNSTSLAKSQIEDAGYSPSFMSQFRDAGFDSGVSRDGQIIFSSPSMIRSRFAAFDPARRNEADLLGRADPRLLGLIGLGTGAGVYGANK
jgi:hypothetical protein